MTRQVKRGLKKIYVRNENLYVPFTCVLTYRNLVSVISDILSSISAHETESVCILSAVYCGHFSSQGISKICIYLKDVKLINREKWPLNLQK